MIGTHLVQYYFGALSAGCDHALKEAFVNIYNTVDLSAGLITGNDMGICSTI